MEHTTVLLFCFIVAICLVAYYYGGRLLEQLMLQHHARESRAPSPGLLEPEGRTLQAGRRRSTYSAGAGLLEAAGLQVPAAGLQQPASSPMASSPAGEVQLQQLQLPRRESYSHFKPSSRDWLDVDPDGIPPESPRSPSSVFEAPTYADLTEEDGIVPIGQRLELAFKGSVLLGEVAAFDKEDAKFPYTVHFPNGELEDTQVMLNTDTSKYTMGSDRRPFRFIDPEEAVSEDKVLADLLKDGCLELSEPQLVSFVRRSRELFQREGALVDIPLDGGGIVLFGDLHGDFKSLLSLLRACALRPPEHKFLFLGDYVDRGPKSLEVLSLLLALKLKHPNHVFLLRGNHEDEHVNAGYGFLSECKKQRSLQIFRQLNSMFHYMPVAAVVGGVLFCCHGGIGPGIEKIADIRCLGELFPLGVPFATEQPWQRVMQHLVWADPEESGRFDERGFRFNEARNISVAWSSKATEAFLKATGLCMIVRAHQLFDEGYAVLHSGRVLSLFSSANYCMSGNCGTAAFFDGDVGNIDIWKIGPDAEMLSKFKLGADTV